MRTTIPITHNDKKKTKNKNKEFTKCFASKDRFKSFERIYLKEYTISLFTKRRKKKKKEYRVSTFIIIVNRYDSTSLISEYFTSNENYEFV